MARPGDPGAGPTPAGNAAALEAVDANVHYRWDSRLRPVLEIDPGTTVRIETRTGDDGQLAPGDGPDAVERLDFTRLHALTGPIAVRGAEPGDLLSVRVDALEVPAWGFILQRPGAGLLRGFPTYLRFVDLDAAGGLARFAPGIEIPLSPFLGIMGVAPAGEVRRTIEPGPHGGNLDCRELGTGSTVYLPVQVPGALFSCGDGHAAQGDGEVCVTAIECSLVASLTLGLSRPGFRLRNPVAETHEAWMTLASGRTVEEAASAALEDMLGLLGQLAGLSRADAYALASAAADLRINQLVNGEAVGVRAVLPKSVVPFDPAAIS
jgi:acetamidase/formamidase